MAHSKFPYDLILILTYSKHLQPIHLSVLPKFPSYLKNHPIYPYHPSFYV